MNRRAILAAVAAIAVLSAGIGWIAGRQISSPASIAAETEPPTASRITVPVEQLALSSDLVIRGQIDFSESTAITAAAPADGVAIITRLPKAAGDQLQEGDVIAEVAGRPLFVLAGELPMFRSLTPALEGPDVRQLEEALVRLGFDPGTVDEVYDPQTEAAINAFYRQAGYSPDEPSVDDLERVEQARATVRAARSQVTDLEASGGEGLPESQRLELNRSVDDAADAVTEAKNERTRVLDEAAEVVEATTEALTEAQQALADAEADLAQAEAGSDPETGEPITDTSAYVDAVAEAEVLLSEAEEANTVAVGTEYALGVEQDDFVADAETNLAIAEAVRRESFEAASSGVDSSALADARTSLNDAQTALNRLESEIGISFPSAELVFLSSLPSEVQEVSVEVGETPTGPIMTVTGSSVTVTSSVSEADRALLEEGVEGVMDDESLGVSIAVRVSFVATTPGGPDTSDGRYFVRLDPLAELPDEVLGSNLRVTIPFASTEGQVLAVPLAALSAGADGSSRVEVERDDGTTEIVTVVPGLNARAQGLVEITPTDPGALSVGDRVVVGNTAPAASSNGADGDEEGDTADADADSSEGSEEDSDG